MTIRDIIITQITSGALTMPTIPALKDIATPTQYREVEKMFLALWRAYLAKGPATPISTPYWMKRIGSARITNFALKALSTNGWITSKSLPNNNWGEAYLNEDKLLTYVSSDQLASVRKFHKFSKYMLKNELSTSSDITKIQGVKLHTGLVRNGFMKTGNTQYQFDTITMSKYRPQVSQLVNKGIDKMIQRYPQIVADLANYREAGNEIVDNLIFEAGTYSGGNRTNDPRGRNNRGDLDKIGNPIGFKIMRSLLTIPANKRNLATERGVLNYYLFIAELNGFKDGTKSEKLAFGQQCYDNLVYPVSFDNTDELFENVWLERIYSELDSYFMDKLRNQRNGTTSTYKWSVPIEIDMSASVLGFLGLVLSHRPFMERCNMLGDTLTDAWAHDIITNRTQFKTIMRQCYGSQLTPSKMWDDMQIPYTPAEAVAFDHELHHGELAVANAFKDFIIQECEPQAEMTLQVWNEKFTTKCNRFFNVGEITTRFDLYDTFSNSVRTIHHTDTKRVPDLKSFRRYFITALIHNLDSQVENTTVEAVYDTYGWAIDIHDAIILCPESADLARSTYAGQLDLIHLNRNTILENYFRSIGIKASAISKWKSEVVPLIQPLEGPLKCSPMVLK